MNQPIKTPLTTQPVPIRGPQSSGRNTTQPQSNVEHAPIGTTPKAKEKKKYYSFNTYTDRHGNLVTEKGPLKSDSSSSSSSSSSSDDSRYNIVVPANTTFTITGQSFSNQLIHNGRKYTASYGQVQSNSTTVTALSPGATISIDGKNTGKTTVNL